MMENKIMSRLPSAHIFRMNEIVQVKPHQVMSLTTYANQSDSFLLFSYDEGEGVSREILQEDSLYYVLEGHVQITINKTNVDLHSWESIVIANDVPHSIVSVEPSKILAIHVGN